MRCCVLGLLLEDRKANAHAAGGFCCSVDAAVGAFVAWRTWIFG